MTPPADDFPFICEAWRDGSAFSIKAHAGARRDGPAGIHDGMIRVDVTAAPEKGKANKALQKLLAKALSVPAADLELLSGDTNPRKRWGVRGLAPDETARRLRVWLR